jgi:hypothetical protein
MVMMVVGLSAWSVRAQEVASGVPMAVPPAEDAPTAAQPGASAAEVSRETSILMDVFLQMRLAGKLLEKKDWQKTVAVQEEIVARLDELLRSAAPPSSPPPGGQRERRQEEQSAPNPEASQQVQQPTRSQPTETTGEKAQEEHGPQTAQLREILRGLWGQLPERVRSQVSETLAEQFLPQYAPLIEQYYRRLSEMASPP